MNLRQPIYLTNILLVKLTKNLVILTIFRCCFNENKKMNLRQPILN